MNPDGERSGEVYDIIRINKALDDLGMLSSSFNNQKEYMQDCLRDRMEQLNVNPQQSGASTSWDSGPPKNPISPVPSASPSKTPRPPVKSPPEKENNIGGFQILKMHSAFITSFTAGYELPCHGPGFKDRLTHRVVKCCFARRRRLRTHPYENSTPIPSLNMSEGIGVSEASQSEAGGYYRLRTTSLSSGTKKKASVAECTENKTPENSASLIRSRSMENLSATMDEGLVLSSSRPKELETVSRGIQELRMDDTT